MSTSSHTDSGHVDVLAVPERLATKIGYFATGFKLYLAPRGANLELPTLPSGITVERMICDYLRCLSEFILSQLQLSYGDHLAKEDIQWCLTVPAIWDERAKQVMKICAEKAGMVKKSEDRSLDPASPYPLEIILEPEAASVYCQRRVEGMTLRKGDKMLVADVGGGTIDLVVHEKAEDDSKSLKVKEAVASYGEIGGGTFIDMNFFNFLSAKVPCFKEFSHENPSLIINVHAWWQGIKMGFDGYGYSGEIPLNGKLSEAWKKHDRERGIFKEDDEYYELRLEDSDFSKIFDPEVDKVIRLIERHIRGIRVCMVVGGFSESPYLRKRIQSRFKERVEKLIMPDNPGSAICHGAVQLHLSKDIIQSRISKPTYGIATRRNAKPDDPPEFIFLDDDNVRMCGDVFHVFVREGGRVALNESIKRTYRPSSHNVTTMRVTLYSSTREKPKYITEMEAVREGHFDVEISEGMELDKYREVEVTMCFGASVISVTAQRVNFGKQDVEQGLSVTFRW